MNAGNQRDQQPSRSQTTSRGKPI